MVNRVCQCNLFLFSCNKCARSWMEPHKQFCCWKRADYRLFTVIVLFPNKSTRFVLHLLCRWAGQPMKIQPLPQFFELVFQTWKSKRISLNYSPKLERKVERSVQCDHRAVDGVGLDSAKPHIMQMRPRLLQHWITEMCAKLLTSNFSAGSFNSWKL